MGDVAIVEAALIPVGAAAAGVGVLVEVGRNVQGLLLEGGDVREFRVPGPGLGIAHGQDGTLRVVSGVITGPHAPFFEFDPVILGIGQLLAGSVEMLMLQFPPEMVRFHQSGKKDWKRCTAARIPQAGACRYATKLNFAVFGFRVVLVVVPNSNWMKKPVWALYSII